VTHDPHDRRPRIPGAPPIDLTGDEIFTVVPFRNGIEAFRAYQNSVTTKQLREWIEEASLAAVSLTPPLNPKKGKLWFDLGLKQLFVNIGVPSAPVWVIAVNWAPGPGPGPGPQPEPTVFWDEAGVTWDEAGVTWDS
jgi:hypothetical protein